jgi:hypothetical protein
MKTAENLTEVQHPPAAILLVQEASGKKQCTAAIWVHQRACSQAREAAAGHG